MCSDQKPLVRLVWGAVGATLHWLVCPGQWKGPFLHTRSFFLERRGTSLPPASLPSHRLVPWRSELLMPPGELPSSGTALHRLLWPTGVPMRDSHPHLPARCSFLTQHRGAGWSGSRGGAAWELVSPERLTQWGNRNLWCIQGGVPSHQAHQTPALPTHPLSPGYPVSLAKTYFSTTSRPRLPAPGRRGRGGKDVEAPQREKTGKGRLRGVKDWGVGGDSRQQAG